MSTRRLAEALGQDPELLDRIGRGEVHPGMAAFGLWRDEDAAPLEEAIRRGRRPRRPRNPPQR